jgi:prepilin-type N-terminal cleavage/methylation domain-containing protein
MIITKYLLFLTQKKPNSGFTLLESLVAIIIVSLLMTMMAPVLVFSVGTRVQAKRIEIATQVANAYVQGLKSRAIPAPNYTVTVNNYTLDTTTNVRTFTDANRYLIANVAAPSNTLPTCTRPTAATPPLVYPPPSTVPANQKTADGNYYLLNDNGYYCTDPTASTSTATTVSLYCIDSDGSGCANTSNKDMIIQVVRTIYESTPGTTSTAVTDPTKGYIVGVRVYRADAFTTGSTLTRSLPCPTQATCPANQVTQSTRTAGLGSRVAPLYETIAEIPPASTVNYTDLQNRICVKNDYKSNEPISSNNTPYVCQ